MIFNAKVKSIIVTRPSPEGEALVSALERRGISGVHIPTIASRISEVTIPDILPSTGLVFTSPNGVKAFVQLTTTALVPIKLPETVQIIVQGPGTGRAVESLLGRTPDIIGTGERREQLVSLLRTKVPPSKSLVLISPETAREGVIDPRTTGALLRDAGFSVTELFLYESIILETAGPRHDWLEQQVGDPSAHVLCTFFSPSAVRGFLALLRHDLQREKPPDHFLHAAFGPVTAEALDHFGMSPVLVHTGATQGSFVSSLEAWLRTQSV